MQLWLSFENFHFEMGILKARFLESNILPMKLQKAYVGCQKRLILWASNSDRSRALQTIPLWKNFFQYRNFKAEITVAFGVWMINIFLICYMNFTSKSNWKWRLFAWNKDHNRSPNFGRHKNRTSQMENGQSWWMLVWMQFKVCTSFDHYRDFLDDERSYRRL